MTDRADAQFHLERARSERLIAYRAADARVADAHMQLSALHLQRALLLQEVRRLPVGNVSPLRPTPSGRDFSAFAEPVTEPQSLR